MRVLLPWDKLFLYDLRLQTHDDTYNAISKDGVNLTATINIRFRLKHDAVPQLHQTIGPDYVERMLSPEIGNRAREIFAEYTAEEIYSTKRQEIQKKIRTHTEAMLGQSIDRSGPKQESEYGEHYKISLRRDAHHLRHAGARPRAAGRGQRGDQPQDRAVLSGAGVRLPRRAREEGIRAQADRGERHPRLPADGDAGHFRFLRALARHRSDAAACAVAQHQDRDHRQRQGRPAGHPRQRRYADAAQSGDAGRGARLRRRVPDNSEAARQRPAGASPPLLEKTPASNLPSPAERPSPTAVPRAPSAGRRRLARRLPTQRRTTRPAPPESATGAARRASRARPGHGPRFRI